MIFFLSRPTILLLALLTIFLDLSLASAEAPKKMLHVVCTTGMIGDLASTVGGQQIKVTTLLGPGVDPHLYKPTRSDIATLTNADVVFYNGLLLEGKMVDALIRVATLGRKVVAVSGEIEETFLLEPPEFEGNFDPHLWMDPLAWEQVVRVIEKTLIELDPESADAFQKNSASLQEKVRALHEYASRVLSSVPEKSRVLVTAHDAFHYFGRRYGYEVLGIQGISTESEAGVKDIENLVKTLVERNIKAVFVESTVSERNVRALIAGARARGHAVEIGGQLFSDAMGQKTSYEGTYLGMIDHNVTTIARALGGEAPERGMIGKLGGQ